MKIYYGYGQPIEVTDEWNDILLSEDRQERNGDQTETRRHCSLEAYNADGNLLSAAHNGIDEFEDEDAVRSLLSNFTAEQRDLIKAIFIDGVSVSDYAKSVGVSQPAISQRITTIKKKFAKILGRTL
jgi:RNA polymerase sigma factor (sigma-70 family)